MKMERVKGIEPSYSAWEAAALPLSYTRISLQRGVRHCHDSCGGVNRVAGRPGRCLMLKGYYARLFSHDYAVPAESQGEHSSLAP
jgi:hypothetical protein